MRDEGRNVFQLASLESPFPPLNPARATARMSMPGRRLPIGALVPVPSSLVPHLSSLSLPPTRRLQRLTLTSRYDCIHTAYVEVVEPDQPASQLRAAWAECSVRLVKLSKVAPQLHS